MSADNPNDTRFAALLCTVFGIVVVAITAGGIADGFESGRWLQVALFGSLPPVYIGGLFWVFKSDPPAR